MDSNRNTVLHVILLGLAALLLCGLGGCKMGSDTKATPEHGKAKELREAREKMARLEKENTELGEKVADLEHENGELRRELVLKKTLLKIAEDQGFFGEDPFPTPAIEAIVQKVDSELKFVMLSVGSDDKVSKGMRFFISRDGSYVGEVRVDWVNQKSCSASFVMLKDGMKMQVGDTASSRL